jgi:hypothetical protein
MGRYVELARRTIETLHAGSELLPVSSSSSNQHCPYERNERNERSLSLTSAPKALQGNGMALEDWAVGVSRLKTMPAPHTYPAPAWQQLIVDAEQFLVDWAEQAVALGWPDWAVFGCHRRAPWGRIAGMGLVLLIRGDELAALTSTEAAIRTRTGARQIYRRRPHDPLDPAERCLLWELG